MQSSTESKTDYAELLTEISYSKRELKFLLTILRNAYSVSANGDKIKLLDKYWKAFELNLESLTLLSDELEKEEEKQGALTRKNPIEDTYSLISERTMIARFDQLTKNTNELKNNFYEYMDGCSACSLKSPMDVRHSYC
jgi:hypothetical protein